MLKPWLCICRVYVHCTAGLGRAPAVIIAYLFWFKDMGLDEVSCQLRCVSCHLHCCLAVCLKAIIHASVHDCDLQAYKHLTDIRPCGPKRDAIRGATFDLCSGRPAHEFDQLDNGAFCGMSQHERDTLRHRVMTWGS